MHGLAEADVNRFIESTTGVTPAASLVTVVHAKTEGNPFFVSEIVRLLDSEGRLHPTDGAAAWSVSIPPGVCETIRRRLARLPRACTRLLGIAAVIGRESGGRQ
ncbi:MAG: hypothetical protein HYZ72_16580 [Deltaproteobacteria bacterium]|nr:hypothetical protein [Deltaproteobacteria bacterium]